MEFITRQALGGVAKAKKIRAAYNENPNICQWCSKPILASDGQVLSDVKSKKFCNRSCSAQYNNRHYPKRLAAIFSISTCLTCTEQIFLKPKRGGGFQPRKYCGKCVTLARIFGRNHIPNIENRTKGEIFSARSSWQSARSSIRRHAVSVYLLSGKSFSCYVCGYHNHVEICHLNKVSSFGNDTTIAQINSPHNLIALCPNHHWEFDHDGLKISAK